MATSTLHRCRSRNYTTSADAIHDLVCAEPGQEKDKALLGDLLAVLLAPYDDRKADGSRVHVSVPDIRVGEAAATTLALVVHELATNSIKYGVLSAVDGRLDVSCSDCNEDVVLTWAERGGPPVTVPLRPAGFGTKLVAQSVSGQLGGSIAYDWSTVGVTITLRMSKTRLAR